MFQWGEREASTNGPGVATHRLRAVNGFSRITRNSAGAYWLPYKRQDRKGIYKHTRNPMYLGFLLLLLGWATFLSNLAPFALLPAFVLYMNYFQIRPEERALDSLFAQEYQAYRARVRRWV